MFFCHPKNVNMLWTCKSVHATCDASRFNFSTPFVDSQCIAFFCCFCMWCLGMRFACACCLFTLSFWHISSSCSGIAGNQHAAATAGASCSITGDPYHGKHLQPLKMAPIAPKRSFFRAFWHDDWVRTAFQSTIQ